jgi:hypothetical protein
MFVALKKCRNLVLEIKFPQNEMGHELKQGLLDFGIPSHVRIIHYVFFCVGF